MKTAGRSPTGIEARRASRKTLRSIAEIVVHDRDQPIECTVLDLSASGAKLKVSGAQRRAFAPAVALPDVFRLVIPRDNMQMDCRLAWREADMLGVAFTSGFRPIKAVAVPAVPQRRR